jgi:hypothetical protein
MRIGYLHDEVEIGMLAIPVGFSDSPAGIIAPHPLARQHGLGCCNAVATSTTGQFLPPSLPTAKEELASTPDAKARNRYESFRLMERPLQSNVSVAPPAPR